jgi:hypothetical protein
MPPSAPKTFPSASLFAHSQYCWASDHEPARNLFVSFEYSLALGNPLAGPLVIHLFADSRYRLWVNESFVAFGPGRFVTAHPEFDSHDLAQWLHTGGNRIRVEVNFYGCSSFQTMSDGRPGFIAAGGSSHHGIDFATPGPWVARVHRAWDAQAPHFSFAQNPAEICDTRALSDELASPATNPIKPLPPEATPWPKPFPRSVPYPDYASVSPARIVASGPIAPTLRWGHQTILPIPIHAGEARPKISSAFATWINSPRDQTVTLEIFWANAHLNGEPVTITYPKRLGNHGQSEVSLRAGWNFLAGRFEILLQHWPFLLGLPLSSDCTLHALPDINATEAFAFSPVCEDPVVPPCPDTPADYTLSARWFAAASNLEDITPARTVAWDSLQPASAVRDIGYTSLPEVAAQAANAALWTFDFADEYYGHPVIEVEAPAGSILDLAYDDWLRADGCVNLFNSNPFTDSADRFILSGGRQRIEVLNPRGGIYLQVVLRAPAGSSSANLILHDLAVRRRTTLNERAGSFASEDPLLDWAWHISTHTLQASTDEAYSDCPWRERASYIGDSMVNTELHRLISADVSVARRTLDLFGRSQLPDGQLQCTAPAWLNKPHEDFTLLWILGVRNFWARTGDTSFASAQLPVIRRIFTSPNWNADADDLWDATGMRLFIDWGVIPSEREGRANSVINILRVVALRAAADLCRAAGKAGEASSFETQADRVSDALLRRVWNDAEGRFLASDGATTTAIHANILALRYGIGPADRLLTYLDPLLRQNFKHGIAQDEFSGFAELYFFFYLLPALAKHGEISLAESLISETYEFIKSLAYPTLTECFHRADRGSGSCCHSWSGAPALYAIEYVLGLRQITPGDPNSYIVDPVDSGREQVSGSIPHAGGLISVSWQRQPNGRVAAQISCPSRVRIFTASHVDLIGVVAR